jgi:hypothetical protein
LLRPISDEDEAELRALDPLSCPATLALIPAFKALDPDAAFDTYRKYIEDMVRKLPKDDT